MATWGPPCILAFGSHPRHAFGECAHDVDLQLQRRVSPPGGEPAAQGVFYGQPSGQRCFSVHGRLSARELELAEIDERIDDRQGLEPSSP